MPTERRWIVDDLEFGLQWIRDLKLVLWLCGCGALGVATFGAACLFCAYGG